MPTKSFARHTRFPEVKRSDLLFELRWEDVVPLLISTKVIRLRLGESRRLSLAGNITGDAPWSISDSLLIESFVDDRLYAMVIVGGYGKLSDSRGEFVSRLGMTGVEFGAKHIAISNLVPINKNVLVRFSALYGGLYGRPQISDLYLIVE